MAAFVTLVISAIFGGLVALKFTFPSWLRSSAPGSSRHEGIALPGTPLERASRTRDRATSDPTSRARAISAPTTGTAGLVLAPAPTSFRVQQPDRARAIAFLGGGGPGSSMPAWGDRLDDADRALLADYVRTLWAAGGEP